MNAQFAGGPEGVKEVVRLEAGSHAGLAGAEGVLERLARAGRFRDEESAEHVERVSRTCALIARELGWDGPACGRLRFAAAMHDIGKVGVPDAILQKQGSLSPDERRVVEAHTEIGYEILAGSGSLVLELAATVALTHHERYDGDGYPRRLKAEEIPEPGRIAAVADVFDALTNDRAYRSAFSISDALDKLREGRGGQFDPEVVAAFEATLPEIEAVRELYPDAPEAGRSNPIFVSAERPIRTLIAIPQGAAARGLELLLREQGIEVAGSASSADAAEALLARRAVDVVLLDPAPDREGASRLSQAARRHGAAVLLYSASAAPHASALGVADADGAVAAEGTSTELVTAIRTVARGETYTDPRLSSGGAPATAGVSLTTREQEVCTLLATGLSGEEIAEKLFLSAETVRTHIRNAMQRLGVKTRAQLIAQAITTGQISPDRRV
ncbi:MAG: HD domain-containing phosphohydrolase [Actinomycetota bacterium]